MNQSIPLAAMLALLSLSACDRPTVVVPPAPVSEPGPPGPAGPAGPQGDTGYQGNQGNQGLEGIQGETGKPGEGTTVIVVPPADTTPPN